MANTISPNMGLIVPGVGTEPGPTWSNDLNADLGILDQHNHSNGQGVQITTAGLNINTDLPINGNNITTVKTVNFTAQLTALPGLSPNLGCIYVAGNELYYNDESGNVVPITNMGTVNAGAGSITGLPSGTASASYSSGSQTFIWQSATSTAANMDNGSVTIREVAPGANGITIQSPGSLAADYTLTLLPNLPATTSILTVDNSGNIGVQAANSPFIDTNNIVDGAVTPVKMSAPNMVISGSSGVFVYSGSSTFVTITNFSVSITTAGKPVTITMQSDGSGVEAYVGSNNSTSSAVIQYQITRNGTPIALYSYKTTASLDQLGSGINFIDIPVAGTYTYEIQANVQTGSTNNQVSHMVMVVREL